MADSENSERGGRPGYYVLDTFYFTENSLKNINTKFHIKRGGRGPFGQLLNPPMFLAIVILNL